MFTRSINIQIILPNRVPSMKQISHAYIYTKYYSPFDKRGKPSEFELQYKKFVAI